MRVRPSLLLSLVAVVALTGCGAAANTSVPAKFSGSSKQIAQVVEDLQSATSDRKQSKICGDLLTAALAQRIGATAGPKGCAQAVKDAIRETDQSDLTVRTVTIDGADAAKARAVVKQKLDSKHSRDTTLSFEKVGARWRISAFG